MLEMGLFRAPSVGELVQNDLGDLHLRAGNPGHTPLVEFNLCVEDGVQSLSPAFSIAAGAGPAAVQNYHCGRVCDVVR